MKLTIREDLINFILSNYKNITNRILKEDDITEIIFRTTRIIVKINTEETFYVYYREIINK